MGHVRIKQILDGARQSQLDDDKHVTRTARDRISSVDSLAEIQAFRCQLQQDSKQLRADSDMLERRFKAHKENIATLKGMLARERRAISEASEHKNQLSASLVVNVDPGTSRPHSLGIAGGSPSFRPTPLAFRPGTPRPVSKEPFNQKSPTRDAQSDTISHDRLTLPPISPTSDGSSPSDRKVLSRSDERPTHLSPLFPYSPTLPPKRSSSSTDSPSSPRLHVKYT